MTHRIGILLLCGLLGCGVQDSGGGTPSADSVSAAQARKPAPPFALNDVEGRTISLADQLGKTVVIDFWATWCPPCLFQVPELNKLWAAHRDKGDLAIIGVAIDVEGASVVAPWIAEQGVEYPIALGDENLAREFGALGFPTLAIVDPAGRIHSLHVGLIEHAELEELVATVGESG